MILIAYDGSDDAKAAITEAGRLFPGEPVTVATAWSHFLDVSARSGGIGTGVLIDYDAVDAAARQNAQSRADEGATLAREAGLGDSTGVACETLSSVAETLIVEAERLDARAIVIGSRGLGAVRALFLGSVSDALLHHADRPVIVVPSPEVAAHRAEHLRPVD